MGFVKSKEEMTNLYRETYDFYDVETLTVLWDTKPEIVERLLPPPLKPAKRPLAFSYIANFPNTNFGVSYSGSSLYLRAEFDGEEGSYCLSMPVTNDMAMVGGREVFGYPKKIARIEFNHGVDTVEGWVERHGVRFFEVKANMTGQFNVDDAQEIVAEVFRPDVNPVSYNFKYFPAPEGSGFDYNPRLVREEVQVRTKSIELGTAEIVLRSSDQDPWLEVEVVRVLGAMFTRSDNSMLKGKVVAEADPAAFAPYALLKVDMY
jgi:acetoacetate decarboxylase